MKHVEQYSAGLRLTQHIRFGLSPSPSGHCSLRSHVVYAGSVIHHSLKSVTLTIFRNRF